MFWNTTLFYNFILPVKRYLAMNIGVWLITKNCIANSQKGFALYYKGMLISYFDLYYKGMLISYFYLYYKGMLISYFYLYYKGMLISYFYLYYKGRLLSYFYLFFKESLISCLYLFCKGQSYTGSHGRWIYFIPIRSVVFTNKALRGVHNENFIFQKIELK